MCTKPGLRRDILALSFILALTSFLIFVVGTSIAADDYTNEIYNSRPAAALILITGLVSMFAIPLPLWGSMNENKFCLLLGVLTNLICMTLVLVLCGGLRSSTDFEYSVDLQENCSLTVEVGSDITPNCADYLQSERQTRIRTMWHDWYVKSLNLAQGGKQFTVVMEAVQSLGQCCGIEPPNGCYFGANIFNGTYGNENLPDFCGQEAGWYPSSAKCTIQLEDNSGLYNAGCPYSLPAGTCKSLGYNKGCSYSIQVWLQSRLLPKVKTLTLLTLVNLLMGLLQCCLFGKRKENDVLPTEFTNYKAKKYQKENR